jgi:hypothetical protein
MANDKKVIIICKDGSRHEENVKRIAFKIGNSFIDTDVNDGFAKEGQILRNVTDYRIVEADNCFKTRTLIINVW